MIGKVTHIYTWKIPQFINEKQSKRRIESKIMQSKTRMGIELVNLTKEVNVLKSCPLFFSKILILYWDAYRDDHDIE